MVNVVWVAMFCGWVVRSWFVGVLGFVGLYAMSLYLCARWVGCLPAVACDVCTFGFGAWWFWTIFGLVGLMAFTFG